MGFLGIDEAPTAKRQPRSKLPSLETLHKGQCSVCPLGANGSNPAFYRTLKHPHMQPFGKGSKPMVYVLGEAPGKVEDRIGEPFVGPSGGTLREYLPAWADDYYVRWGNVVRTRPPKNRTPDFIEVECCRPSVVADIEMHEPFAIVGFGNVPLHWAIGERGITNWSGRCLPVQVGKHSCWYFPIVHPSAILRGGGKEGNDRDKEFAFGLDIERAFDKVEDLWDAERYPQVHTEEDALANLEMVDGSGGDADVDRVLEMFDHCWDEQVVGYDYETKNKRPYAKDSKLLSLGLSTATRTMGFALGHKQAGWNYKQLDRILDALEDFLLHANCRKVVHALGFEQEWTAFEFGHEPLRDGLWGDTLMQAYVLDERRGALSLEFLCLQHFGLNIKDLSAVNVKDLDAEPIGKVLKYQGVDARYHRLLYLKQHERLLDDGTIEFYEQMLRRVPTMVLTQLKGIPIDQPTVQGFYKEWMGKRTAVEERIASMKLVRKFRERFDKDFRPSATGDAKDIFRLDGLHLDSVDEEDLKKVKHPLAQAILDYREAHKILSTYVLPVLDTSQMDLSESEEKELKRLEAGSALHPDGRMHPITTLHKTRTSRSASEETNYQNWPKREHKEIRTQVKVLKKWKLVSFDYGQIQARNVAMESLDKNLIKAFWDRYDIHHDWTERAVDIYPKWMDEKGGVKAVRASVGQKENWWKWYRDKTKNQFVFPSFFGAMPPHISSISGIPQNVVERLHKQFWIMFPSIKGWQNRLIDDFYRDGYTTSLAGHRRHAPASTNEIINAPIQADEAIIVCDAMARLSELGKWKFQANMEIHDDLTFIWPAQDVEDNSIVVIEKMVKVPFKWAHVVPIVVEMSIGDDWGNKTDVGNYASDTWNRSLGIDDNRRHELGIW